MYVRDGASRALFQGDIFDDVPLTKAAAGDTPDRDPKWSGGRGTAAAILYPCDMVAPDNVTLVKAQAIVRVYDAAAKGLSIPADWEGVLGVCPLPDLRGDGRMWVADFRTQTTVDRSYLRVDKRVRCLSELGWAVFRQRLAGSLTRAVVPIDDMLEIGAPTWEESRMEAEWVEAGRERRTFHAWLDAPSVGQAPDATRRLLLHEPGGLETVRHMLSDALQELDLG